MKELTIDVIGQGTWSATPSWMITANDALSELGPKFQNTMWSRWLVLGSFQQVLALVLLRIPKLKRFVFTANGEPHEFTSYSMFMDLELKDFFRSLPKCRSVCSKQWLNPFQMDFLRPTHAEFIISCIHCPLPPLVRRFHDGPFPFYHITTMIIHLHINLLVENPDPREQRMSSYLGHLLKHCHQLKAFKALLHSDGDFTLKPLFAPNMEAFKRIFRRVIPSDSVEILDISIGRLKPEYIASMQSFRSLVRFRGLKKLKAPQSALSILRTAWDPAFYIGSILGRIEELTIIHANSYVNQFGIIINHHKRDLPKLKKLEVRYRDDFHASEDLFEPWVTLSKGGVQVVLRTQDSKQAQTIINGEIV